MATANYSLNMRYKATPFIWGSLQDEGSLQMVYQGAPFFVTSAPPPTKYEYTAQGWLKKVVSAEGTVTVSYDDTGNRTSVAVAL